MDCRSLFINKDKVVLTSVELACVVGDLEEAVVLNQISYWIEKYKETNHNFRDSKYWVYNSYQKWHDDNFPFWHTSKIQRIFKSLEKKGLLISANYNSAGFDKTKWYSIDYEKLQNMIDEHTYENKPSSLEYENSLIENELSLIENEQSLIDSDYPIPGEYIQENTTEDNNRDYYKYASPDKSGEVDINIYASFPEEKEVENSQKKSRYIPEDYAEEQLIEHIKPVIENSISYICDEENNQKELSSTLIEIIRTFYRKYYLVFGKRHRILSDMAYKNIAERFIFPPDVMGDEDKKYDIKCYLKMMSVYFDTEYNKQKKYDKGIELSISHFMSDKIRSNLFYRTCYCGDEE